MSAPLNLVDSVPLVALALFALVLVGIAGLTHTVLTRNQPSSVDSARFLVISMNGFLVALSAYMPILISRWLHDKMLVFRICTLLHIGLVIWAYRWRKSHPDINKPLDRMRHESQYPKIFSRFLVFLLFTFAILNLLSWPIQANQTFYELLLVSSFAGALLHFVNLVVFRIEDNLTLENPINEGWEAVIYASPDDNHKVLKLFNFYNRSWAENEVQMTKAAAQAGLPCPAVYTNVVEINGRFGFYMEKIDGKAFENQGVYGFSKKSRELSQEFAQFHVKLHEIRGVQLPIKFKDVAHTSIENAAELTNAEKDQVIEVLDSLPDGDRVYHGDFHPGNVMRRDDNGELVIVDWVRVMTGHPLADVARASMILSTAWLEYFPVVRRAVRVSITRFIRLYEETYFSASGIEPQTIEPWRLVVAAMIMGEEPIDPKQTRYLAKIVRKYLRQTHIS